MQHLHEDGIARGRERGAGAHRHQPAQDLPGPLPSVSSPGALALRQSADSLPLALHRLPLSCFLPLLNLTHQKTLAQSCVVSEIFYVTVL